MARGYQSGLLTGVALSLGAMLLSPLWKPAAARWGRPAAKAVLKGGVQAYALGRERAAEMGEAVSDMLAEVQFELAAEHGSAAQEAAPAGPRPGVAPGPAQAA